MRIRTGIFPIALFMFISVFSGCSLNPLYGDIEATASSPTNSEKDQSLLAALNQPTTYNGTMAWKYTDTTNLTECSPHIEATVTMQLVEKKDTTFAGTGTITIADESHTINLTASKKILSGTTEQLVVTPTVPPPTTAQDTVTLLADPPNPLCPNDVTRYLQFSLEQAGFFSEWSVAVPTKNGSTTVIFDWAVDGQTGTGFLVLTEQ